MADEEDRSFVNPPADPATETPADAAMAKLGQDNPEEDWGEPGDEGATYSSNHAQRGEKGGPDLGHGAKTRAAFKDQVSRRG